jgi:hypothetical protein
MANRDTLFITAEYVKARTFVDANVDEKTIGNAIWEAQRFNLIQLIGSGLYDELETQSDAGTLTAVNQTLLHKYIAPALKYWTLLNLAPTLLYKLTNKSITTKGSDNTSSVDYTVMNRLMEDFTNKAQQMSKELRDYLIENEQTYPKYINPGSSSDTIHPETNVFESGIYLGGTSSKNVSLSRRMDNPGTFGCDED